MKPRSDPGSGSGAGPRRAGPRAITSLQNERVKLIRSLTMRKARRETGLFVAEGASLLVTARDAGWKPRMLAFLGGSARSGVARDLVHWAEAAGAECLEVSPAVLAKLAISIVAPGTGTNSTGAAAPATATATAGHAN